MTEKIGFYFSGTDEPGMKINFKDGNNVPLLKIVVVEKCKWKLDEEFGDWDIECRNEIKPYYVSPIQKGYAFCPFCGKELFVDSGDD